MSTAPDYFVIPAKAGIQDPRTRRFPWAPASAGVTKHGITLAALGAFVLALWVGADLAAAQDTAAEEAAHRAEVIAHLPHDAAKLLFGRETTPALGPAEAIGSYERGCL